MPSGPDRGGQGDGHAAVHGAGAVAEHPAEVDHRADIYSLGVVFYQMLTGELPGKPIEPPSQKVQIDVRLDEVVLRALEKEPERRYQQVSQVKIGGGNHRDNSTSTEHDCAGYTGGRSHTNTQPSADELSPWCQYRRHCAQWHLHVSSGNQACQHLCPRLSLCPGLFLVSYHSPGMHSCVGFAGFSGFFGLIGFAVIVELSSRCKAEKGGGKAAKFTAERANRQQLTSRAPRRDPRRVCSRATRVSSPRRNSSALSTVNSSCFAVGANCSSTTASSRSTCAGAFTIIPLAAIRDLSIGHYPRIMHPVGLNFISVTYDENGETKRLFFSPYESGFGRFSIFNRIIAEWFSAIVLPSSTPRARARNTPANQLGVPSGSKVLYALLLLPLILGVILVLP